MVYDGTIDEEDTRYHTNQHLVEVNLFDGNTTRSLLQVYIKLG